MNLFFKGVGAIFDEQTNSFTFEKPPNMSTLIKFISDITEFFKIRGFKTDLDQNCENLLSRQSKIELDLDNAYKVGTDIKSSTDVELNMPDIFKRKLLPYQKKSVKHLHEVGNAANFSVPGSGKTTISYGAYALLKSKGIVEKIFVVCPRAAFVPWLEEFEGCFGYPPDSIRLEGSRVDSNILQDVKDKELILSTYMLPLNHSYAVSTFLEKYKVLMIIDESHNIKRIEGKQSNALLDLAPYATRRFILTGTPMPQGWDDVWTQFTFLWPTNNILDQAFVFKEHTRLRNNLGRYKEKIYPLFTRISKKTLGLKEPKWEQIKYPLAPIQKRIYDSIALKIFHEINNINVESVDEGGRMRKWRRNRMLRLIQAASNPTLLNKPDTEFDLEPISSAGLDVSELIEKYTSYGEIPSKLQEASLMARQLLKKGEKVILWTNFVHNIDMLKDQLLKDVNPLWVDGRVPKDESEDYEHNREKVIQEFKEDSNPRVFIATPASCAESVSLHKYKGKTVCKNAIYIDRTYNAAQYMQSLDRIHRIGMDPDTQVTYWLCIAMDTYDVLIDQKLKKKIQNMYDLLDEDIRVDSFHVTETEVTDDEIKENFNDFKEYLKSKFGNAD